MLFCTATITLSNRTLDHVARTSAVTVPRWGPAGAASPPGSQALLVLVAQLAASVSHYALLYGTVIRVDRVRHQKPHYCRKTATTASPRKC
ncbi:hypothetical protein [Lentzea sp.]|uniref:hypothetical protein n=1 Tax=Lentzea sp. TaxID=56099 RepID=UPI002C093075|nr:hypothetical protein [Lentzea sp.]HUQ55217.1 hypothetical protein [Lentzea sp.]